MAASRPHLDLTDYPGLPSTPVYLPHNLTEDQFLRLLPKDSSTPPAYEFPALQNWLKKLVQNFKLQDNDDHPHYDHPFKLRSIDVQAVDWFSKSRLGFMKIQAEITSDPYGREIGGKAASNWLPGAVFLRGGSVAVLVIVQPQGATGEEEKHVVFTVQPRIAAASLAFVEIPAGMLDGGSLAGKAATELKEEADLTVEESELTNMSKLALNLTAQNQQGTETVEDAMYPSAGACDEFIPLLLCQKRLTRAHMDDLKGKATGLRNEGEMITLKLIPLEDAWKEGARDAKTLAALALYTNLQAAGKLPDMPSEPEDSPRS